MSNIKIVELYPPNMALIRKHFGQVPKNTVFTYGNKIYNPGKGKISNPLWIHELTHIAQQNNDADAWWERYCTDIDFRIEQEVEAYSNEYNSYRSGAVDSASQNVYLKGVATKLSSPLYGNVLSFAEAYNLIKNHADRGYSKR